MWMEFACVLAKVALPPSTQAIHLLVQESLISSGLQANKNRSCGYKLRSEESTENVCALI